MTDEEMAEEYEEVQDYCGLLDVLSEEQYNQDYGGLSCYISPYIEQAFLAGLKAGKPKWHKVADGDLPKNENDVLVYSGEEWRMCIGRYSPKNKAWEAGCDAIAWCEIPEYKKE